MHMRIITRVPCHIHHNRIYHKAAGLGAVTQAGRTGQAIATKWGPWSSHACMW